MNVFKRIDRLYIKDKISEQEWYKLTLKHMYLRGLITKKEYEKSSPK